MPGRAVLMVPRLATLGLLVLFACSSNGAVEGSVDTYANTVYIAPTWDLTADGPAEVDEALIRQGLTEIRNAFGTGLAHGPHAQPGITFYCLYEGPLAYRLAQDAGWSLAFPIASSSTVASSRGRTVSRNRSSAS
jgi:hypothetical protein